MAAPTGTDVAAFLGESGDAELVALADQHVAVVTALARSYTRDRGFAGADPAVDIAAVIVVATARLLPNPEQVRSESVGEYTVAAAPFVGWSLAELFVLNRYRRRSA